MSEAQRFALWERPQPRPGANRKSSPRLLDLFWYRLPTSFPRKRESIGRSPGRDSPNWVRRVDLTRFRGQAVVFVS